MKILESAVIISIVVVTAAFSAERQRCAGLDSFNLAACGGATLAASVKTKAPCAIARHLETFASWIDTLDGKPCSSSVAGLAERYESFTDTTQHAIDLDGLTCAGSTKAPITLVLYVSMSCPLCKRVYKELYQEITKGALRNRAKLFVKVFSSRPADVALLAAGKLKRQSDLLLALAGIDERITADFVVKKAGEIGMPVDTFKKMLKDSALIKAAEVSGQEGERNGVKVTPTAFINGKRYKSYKDARWIVDAVQYEFELLAVKKKK